MLHSDIMFTSTVILLSMGQTEIIHQPQEKQLHALSLIKSCHHTIVMVDKMQASAVNGNYKYCHHVHYQTVCGIFASLSKIKPWPFGTHI